jgi:hypothetical protein
LQERLFPPLPIISVLAFSTGCGNVFISGAINPGSTMTGAITFVQLGNVLNGTGGTVQVTDSRVIPHSCEKVSLSGESVVNFRFRALLLN